MPRRAPRAGNAFELSRRYRLPPLLQADPATLARLRAAPEAFCCELAWDGHRVLAAREGDDVRIVSADLREWGGAFPTLALALRRLPAQALAAEGHVCALDERGQPSFDVLRQRVMEGGGVRVVLVLWDLLHLDGEELGARTLSERRQRLLALLAGAPDVLLPSETLPGGLDDLLPALRALGVRGLVARESAGTHPPREPWVCLGSDGTAGLEWERSLSAPPRVTNAAKVLFPRDGFTKQDVVDYYADVAPLLLPLLRERPVVAQRWPDGIDDFTWYQHRLPPKAPDYLRSVRVDDDRRIVVEGPEGLLWLANQAALTFHGWTSRLRSLEQPDWCLLDLDPGEKTAWTQTIEVALALRRLLELLELPSVVKTSGQKGLHVMIPLAPGQSAEQAHAFALAVARMLERLLPDVVSLEQDRVKRAGRLFLDHLQNYRGKTLVLPYSLRARDGAPVSTPLLWSEVTPALDPRAFNLRTLRRRLDARGDLAAALPAPGARLAPALARLA